MLGTLDTLAASVLQLTVLDVAIEIGWETAAERDASGVAVIDRPLETCLLTWCDLRVLRLRGIPVSSATISAIAALQLLEELNIQTTSLLTPLEGGLGTFAPSLKTLHIHIDFLSWATKFLAHISSSRLESLSVFLADCSPAYTVSDFCTVIAQHQSRLALREIRILQARMASPDTTTKPEHLRPLLQLPQLAVLSIEGRESFGIDIDDSFLGEMASAWPELEILKLDPLDPCLPAVTWAGLVRFAHLCPKLRSIKLGIDTGADVPAFDNLLVRPAAPSSLVSLHVGRAAPPRDPVQLAAFLFEHFPLLDSVSSYPRREDYAQTILGWKKVKDILYELRLVRRQERNWSQGQGPVASPRS
ncbi:hypothetical protein OH76DRAFT_1483819 [Lentinus brumalis]|uniref:F-box domain-containing protein n=1 Tax=Lentinus brumalis TaxID=2498619 RepID=A0A371D7G6_9APHY|nr:hypothetical protein OH76DRAFT_1483819 [Polyporus brumalis]